MKEVELAKLKNKTMEEKYGSELRASQARERIISTKKSEY